MNVVIVDADVSYPPTSGKRLRTLHLMQRLAQRHRITYVARGSGDAEQGRQAVEYLGGLGIRAVVVDHPVARQRGVGFYARLAANLLSPWPYSVATHQSPPLAQALREHVAHHRVDLWQVEWPGYLTTLPPGPTPRLLQAPNVDTLIWERYQATETNPLKRWYIGTQRRKFERFERWAFAAFTRVVAVSAEDADLARRRFGLDNIDVVDNGIDRAFFASVRPVTGSKCVLFLGALDWRPNLDAVRLLLDRIFPALRLHEPAARLAIVGRRPPPWLSARAAAMAGVELHADVADVRPYLAQAGVLAVPLRIGGGSRLKILEALACGVPVVSSRVGAEGLCLEPGAHYTLAEEQDMAAALVGCLRQPEQARAQAERGRRVVLQRYDWDVLADRMERVWEKCVGGPRAPLAAGGRSGEPSRTGGAAGAARLAAPTPDAAG
jgi:glycosyltransferase involved in cell wall biosynthesis